MANIKGGHKGGRPTIITEKCIKKLLEASSWGCNTQQSIIWAGLTHQTAYNYFKKNPKFLDNMKLLRQTPNIHAKRTLLKGVKENSDLALRFLERVERSNYSLKQEVEHSGKVFNQTVIVADQKTKDNLDKLGG